MLCDVFVKGRGLLGDAVGKAGGGLLGVCGKGLLDGCWGGCWGWLTVKLLWLGRLFWGECLRRLLGVRAGWAAGGAAR